MVCQVPLEFCCHCVEFYEFPATYILREINLSKMLTIFGPNATLQFLPFDWNSDIENPYNNSREGFLEFFLQGKDYVWNTVRKMNVELVTLIQA